MMNDFDSYPGLSTGKGNVVKSQGVMTFWSGGHHDLEIPAGDANKPVQRWWLCELGGVTQRPTDGLAC